MLMSRRHEPSAGSRQARARGLSLIELLVALTLGMLVAAALLKLFATSSANGQNLRRSSAQIENGRFAAELLQEELRLAGFLGEVRPEGATFSTADPCQTAPTDFVADPRTVPAAIRGYGPAEVVPCLLNRMPDTDALLVRRLEVFPVAAASLTAANQQHYVQSSLCPTESLSREFVIERDPAAFVLTARDCAAPAPLRAYVSRIYFVASCDRCAGSTGDGPTLKRLDLVAGRLVETSLVDGIEVLRFEYGFDLDDDGSADEYRVALGGAGAASRWENVVSLKFHYIVRSTDKVLVDGLATSQTFDLGGLARISIANDGYTRRAYSSVVRLHNPSGQRELQ
jgi:type IV pilus assembly protein PilW